MPVDLAIVYVDGRIERRRLPVEAWYGGKDFLYVITDGPVRSVILDPDGMLPDIDRTDEAWSQGSGIGPRPAAPTKS
jgi:hypothetical protein